MGCDGPEHPCWHRDRELCFLAFPGNSSPYGPMGGGGEGNRLGLVLFGIGLKSATCRGKQEEQQRW